MREKNILQQVFRNHLLVYVRKGTTIIIVTMLQDIQKGKMLCTLGYMLNSYGYNGIDNDDMKNNSCIAMGMYNTMMNQCSTSIYCIFHILCLMSM